MRGEFPSQEQTTCSGNSRWSSVCLLARIEWNNLVPEDLERYVKDRVQIGQFHHLQ
jgi:hypothetical protein